MTFRIRDFQSGDESAAYYICLKTGDHGQDGESFYRDDPDALARIYVGPYLEYEPKLALMLEDDDGVCGYALGTPDTKGFYRQYEEQWRADLKRNFPEPTGDRSAWTRTQAVYHDYHHGDCYWPEPYELYPAHLHIDLLSRAQGKGQGRLMMEQLMDRLRAAGSPGVHLAMSERNEPAYGFYKRLGFAELERRDGTIYMGYRF